MNADDESLIPHIPVGDWVETFLLWFKATFAWFFDGLTTAMEFPIEHLANWLILVPPVVGILACVLIALVVRSWRFAVFTLVGFTLVLSLELWEPMMQLMAQVIVATVVAVVIAVPVGVLAASNNVVSSLVRPVLDLMQTMPAFVYLIPAVIFFSLGYAPGLFATVIFSLPPGVRMTELGIRQVDSETVEAGESFGATPWQILRGIQLPLAVPTIMAGVNQIIMLALSMAVIAGMVAAPGLGQEVTQAVSTQDLAGGVEAGLSVVLLAVFLDRLTAALGNPAGHPSSLITLIRTTRTRRAGTA
ncbi:ABC transporter permease [Brachybacterium sp. GCM10030252]|uniref:ABC transporter permease n=1 Tax=Brachybacterium sp. GCM10030252 TaxID=3273380 RepID=UPI0036184EF2